MLTDSVAHVIVFTTGVVVMGTFLTQSIIREAWRNRWRGRFGGTPDNNDGTAAVYEPHDIAAFVAELREAYTWWRVVAVTMGAGGAVWLCWWVIYVLVVVMT